MEKFFVYLTNLSSNSAYFIIFGILVACGLGFPLPEDIPLIAAGYLIWDGTLEWFGALVITMAGVLIGDTFLFVLGRKAGLKFAEGRKIQALFSRRKIRRTRAYFRKFGYKIVFFARFVAGIRAVAFFMAGAMKMKYQKFIFLDALAAALSVPVWMAIGYGLGHYLGDEISSILKSIKHMKTGFTITVFIIIAIVLAHSYLKYTRLKKIQKSKSPAGFHHQ